MSAQVALPWAPEPVDGITAFGQTLTLSAWAQRSGIEAGTIRHRMASGWTAERSVSEPVERTNRKQSERFDAEWFKPGSFTWYELPYELDIGAQDFVRKHPGGAEIEEICAATGIEASQCRALLDSAIAKIIAKADADPTILEAIFPGFDRAQMRRFLAQAKERHGITDEQIAKVQAEDDPEKDKHQETLPYVHAANDNGGFR